MDVVPAAAAGYAAMSQLEKYTRSTVDPMVLHLIKVRASVLNGCAFCLDMHAQEALADGEHQRRLFAVAAWREAPFFDERERAALALTDAMTRLGEHGVPDGGGQVRSARRPIRSAAKVARFFASIYSRPPALRAVAIEINAAPAMLIGYPRPRHLLVLDVDAGGIRGIFVLANPDKLATVFTGDRCGPDMIEPGCGRPGGPPVGDLGG